MPKDERPRHLANERKPYDHTVSSSSSSSSSAVTRESAGADKTTVVHKELDAHRIEQRRKQIEFGKNTRGYDLYLQKTPKNMRTRTDPKTPDIHSPIGKRQFDGQVRAWRRQLHNFDDKAEGEEDVFDYKGSLLDEPSAVEPTRSSQDEDYTIISPVDIYGDITDDLLVLDDHGCVVGAQDDAAPKNSHCATALLTPEPTPLKAQVIKVSDNDVSQPPMDFGSLTAGGKKQTVLWPEDVAAMRSMSWADIMSDEEISQPAMVVA